jgi:hypothetical protein
MRALELLLALHAHASSARTCNLRTVRVRAQLDLAQVLLRNLMMSVGSRAEMSWSPAALP